MAPAYSITAGLTVLTARRIPLRINIRVDTHQNQTDFACLPRYMTMDPKLITIEIIKGNEGELSEFQG